MLPNPFDKHSATWIVISEWAQSELDALRVKNDSAQHTELKTALIRGEIKRLKMLLGLPGKIGKENDSNS